MLHGVVEGVGAASRLPVLRVRQTRKRVRLAVLLARPPGVRLPRTVDPYRVEPGAAGRPGCSSRRLRDTITRGDERGRTGITPH